jgi:hypothetical protein
MGFGAKRMETYVDMAGAFIEFVLHWFIVDWAKCAGLDETVDLSSFRLGPFSCVSLEWLILIYFRLRTGPDTLSFSHVRLAVGWWLWVLISWVLTRLFAFRVVVFDPLVLLRLIGCVCCTNRTSTLCSLDGSTLCFVGGGLFRLCTSGTVYVPIVALLLDA